MYSSATACHHGVMRPQKTSGLLLHYLRLRWAKLGAPARTGLVLGVGLVLGALLVKLSAAWCGSCCHRNAVADQAPPASAPVIEENLPEENLPESTAPQPEEAAPGSDDALAEAPVDVGEVMRRCRFAQQCIADELEGRANTPQAMGVRIEALKVLGDRAVAEQAMRDLIERWPTSRQAAAYRRQL